MKRRQIYMKVDHAHAGVPVAIADTPTELARLCGTSLSTVSHAIARARKKSAGRSWYISVWTEWSDKDYKKYFGRKA